MSNDIRDERPASGLASCLLCSFRSFDPPERKEMRMNPNRKDQSGRVGYLVLYLMGVPVGVLILLWVLLGNNLIGAG
jgi:hypothetical protein